MDETSALRHPNYVIGTLKSPIRFIATLTLMATLCWALPTMAAETPVEAIPTGPISRYSIGSQLGVDTTFVQFPMKIESVAPNSHYFFANQFRVVGGDGGYIGLQENGGRANGTTGKTAIFSIFGAGIAAQPAGSCDVVGEGNFDGYVGLSGTSCRIPYNFSTNVVYTTTIQRESSDETGTWWSGKITDQSNGVTTLIARIKVPLSWSGISSLTYHWIEYFGARPATCEQLPYAKVRYYVPVVEGRLSTLSRNYYSSTGNCQNVSVYTSENSQVQEMGGDTVRPVASTTTTRPRNPESTTTSTTATPTTTSTTTTTTTKPNVVPAPSNLSVTRNECFLVWCSYIVRWDTPSNLRLQHTVSVPELGTSVTPNKLSELVWVPNGNRYTVYVSSANPNGTRSSVSSLTFNT